MGKAASDDDRPLIERVRKGDQDAVRTLYERYFDRIYNYVYARLGRVEDAEDLAIDTMTRSLTRLDLFRTRASPSPPGSIGSRTTPPSITTAGTAR